MEYQKTLLSKAMIIPLLSMTAACHLEPERKVKELKIEVNGFSLVSAEGTRLNDCKEFEPTAQQIAHYFNRAYPVERKVMTTSRYTPCYATGSLKFDKKTGGTWTLYSSGVASFEFIRGDVVTLYYKDNQWFDPTACTYTLDKDEQCGSHSNTSSETRKETLAEPCQLETTSTPIWKCQEPTMLFINNTGLVDANRIKLNIFPKIEREKMDKVNGIVVHQTGGPSAQSAFDLYADEREKGAHFLIDKDGTIYQTASLYRMSKHVGRLQSRCFITKKCSATELQRATSLENIKSDAKKTQAVHDDEYKKNFPLRYPWSADAIGIEIVGMAQKENRNGKEKNIYEPVNEQQNAALKWLIEELKKTFHVSVSEIYRHPQIERKNESEASTATW